MDRRERSGDLQAALIAFGEGLKAELWTSMPAVVKSYDSSKQTVVCVVAIQAQWTGQDDTPVWVNLPNLFDVPVQFPRGGGGLITFPIAPGDEGLVVFASRCIDQWWQNGAAQGPVPQAELRMHDLSDGHFLPGFSSVPRVPTGGAAIDPTYMEFRSLDGNAKVRLHPTTHEVDINTTGNLNANVTGTATIAAATINLNGTLVINGEAYTAHKHSNVTNGPNNTGGKV